VQETSVKRIRILPARTLLWRAQIGSDPKEKEIAGVGPIRFPVPLSSPRMKPIAALSTDGRVSPRGIACLYLASNARTACSEVRPWRGALISLGQFVTTRELSIVDCTSDRKMPFFKRFNASNWTGVIWGPSEYESLAWGEICHAMSEPISPDSALVNYVPTQIIAEYLRIHGADGIAYRSLLSKGGINYALFDINDADIVSATLMKTTSIQFRFSAVPATHNPDSIDREDKCMTTSKPVASKSGSLLEDKKTPKKYKPSLASDLSQAKAKPKKKPKR
jgi:hypothetical protein